MKLTYQFRLHDTAAAELKRQARVCNFVWNFCNETQKTALRWGKRWPTGYDLQKLTAGASKELDLHAHTIQQVCQRYAKSREQSRKRTLKWRGKKSLGWVPFNNGTVRFDGEAFVFRGRRYRAWISRDLVIGQKFCTGSFSQDALGRWYINLPIEVAGKASAGTDAVGIDLGLKDIATLSTGRRIEHPQWYRRSQARLAVMQRANKKRQTKRLHSRIKAQRADYLHKESIRLVREHGAIVVGNVSPKAIAKTRMSKSSLDAGWAIFKQQLAYKAKGHGVLFVEVNEAFTTQVCSSCASVEGPKGVAQLGIRRWICSCGVEHDRDINAAVNIVRRGLATLAEGALA